MFHIFNYIIIVLKLVAGNGHDNLSLGEVHIELVSLESRNTGGQFVEWNNMQGMSRGKTHTNNDVVFRNKSKQVLHITFCVLFLENMIFWYPLETLPLGPLLHKFFSPGLNANGYQPLTSRFMALYDAPSHPGFRYFRDSHFRSVRTYDLLFANPTPMGPTAPRTDDRWMVTQHVEKTTTIGSFHEWGYPQMDGLFHGKS